MNRELYMYVDSFMLTIFFLAMPNIFSYIWKCFSVVTCCSRTSHVYCCFVYIYKLSHLMILYLYVHYWYLGHFLPQTLIAQVVTACCMCLCAHCLNRLLVLPSPASALTEFSTLLWNRDMNFITVQLIVRQCKSCQGSSCTGHSLVISVW